MYFFHIFVLVLLYHVCVSFQQNVTLEERSSLTRGLSKLLKKKEHDSTDNDEPVNEQKKCDCSVQTFFRGEGKKVENYPWIVNIVLMGEERLREDTWLGYGTLISVKHVLMAIASFPGGKVPRNANEVLGLYHGDPTFRSGGLYKVVGVTPKNHFGLAMLTVVLKNTKMKPICMPPAIYNPNKKSAKISSWALTPRAEVILREAPEIGHNLKLFADVTATEGIRMITGGGPAFHKCYEENRYFLLGIALTDENACYYANINEPEVIDWITTEAGEENLCISEQCLNADKPFVISSKPTPANMDPSHWECGVSSLYVHGDHETETEFYPWITSIKMSEDKVKFDHLCYGAVITVTQVVSAFCIVEGINEDSKSFVVDLEDPTFIQNRMLRINYPITEVHHNIPLGLTVLTLFEKITVDNHIRPLCMPPRNYEPSGKSARISSWGSIHQEHVGQHSGKVVADVSFVKSLGESGHRKVNQLRARPLRSNGICRVDGGGPAFHKCEEDNSYFMLGMAKNTIDSCFYTNIASTEAETWIESKNSTLDERLFGKFKKIWKAMPKFSFKRKDKMPVCGINSLMAEGRMTPDYPWSMNIAKLDRDKNTEYIYYGTVISLKHIVAVHESLRRGGFISRKDELVVYPGDPNIVHKSEPYSCVIRVIINDDYGFAILIVNLKNSAFKLVRPICMPPEDYNPGWKSGKIAAGGNDGEKGLAALFPLWWTWPPPIYCHRHRSRVEIFKKFKFSPQWKLGIMKTLPEYETDVILRSTNTEMILHAYSVYENGIVKINGGGPVFHKCYEENRYFLLGFLSHEHSPNVYFNVASAVIMQWIKKIVGVVIESGNNNLCRSIHCFRPVALVRPSKPIDVQNPDWECGISTLIGGEEPAEFYPWIVSIQRDHSSFGKKGHIGYGTLISLQHVLVPFGLVESTTAELVLFVVHFGDPTFTENMTPLYTKKIIYNEDRYLFGLSILTLDGEITVSDHVRPICMPPANYDPSGKSARLANWGIAHEDVTLYVLRSNQLQAVDDNRNVISMFPRGGPAFHKCNELQNYFLLGIDTSQDYSKYSNIASNEIQQWIQSIVGNLNRVSSSCT